MQHQLDNTTSFLLPWQNVITNGTLHTNKNSLRPGQTVLMVIIKLVLPSN